MNIQVPEKVNSIIETLLAQGFEAYAVGGCVRDGLLGREADDWDITTSASPYEVKALFRRTIDTGIQHGTVTVMLDKDGFEVTTYRIDGDYEDNRHPVSVSFTGNLEDDLSRRDFTVNAMAYNDHAGLVDKFGGTSDLARGIIKAVGDPYKRFSEDALRVLRALRFASVLDFTVEKETKDAAESLCRNLSSVSAERIFVEWKKLLGGKSAYGILSENRDIISVFLPEITDAKLPEKEVFDALSYEERQTLIFAMTSGEEGFCEFAASLKFDNKTKSRGIDMLRALSLKDCMTDFEIGEYLIGKSDECAVSAAKISDAIGKTRGALSRVKEGIMLGTPRYVKDLDFNGADAAKLGYAGKKCGELLGEILRLCASLELKNNKQSIIDYIENSYKSK
jgi:tRNA nucleotidyltransferase/poly(A) polymerase